MRHATGRLVIVIVLILLIIIEIGYNLVYVLYDGALFNIRFNEEILGLERSMFTFVNFISL